jgi:hypothetical protein
MRRDRPTGPAGPVCFLCFLGFRATARAHGLLGELHDRGPRFGPARAFMRFGSARAFTARRPARSRAHRDCGASTATRIRPVHGYRVGRAGRRRLMKNGCSQSPPRTPSNRAAAAVAAPPPPPPRPRPPRPRGSAAGPTRRCRSRAIAPEEPRGSLHSSGPARARSPDGARLAAFKLQRRPGAGASEGKNRWSAQSH